MEEEGEQNETKDGSELSDDGEGEELQVFAKNIIR